MRNWFLRSSLLLIHPTAIEIYMVLERDRKEHWSICTSIRLPCQLQLTPSLYFSSLNLVPGSSVLVKCPQIYGSQSSWAAGKVPAVFLQPTNTTSHYLFWNWCFSLKILCSLGPFLLSEGSVSSVIQNLWTLGFYNPMYHQHLCIELNVLHLQSMVGLSHIFNFCSLSPAPCRAFFSRALK